MDVNQTSDDKSWFKKNSELVGGIIGWTIFIGFFCVIFFWNNIQAFFALTPQAKCEAFIAESSGDEYCKQDGTKGSRIKDAEVECTKKTPFFKWTIPQNKCERVLYASKQECINDGRQRVDSYEGQPFGVRCLDNGNWETYDPEYESYLAEEAFEDYSSNCHPSYDPCVPNSGSDLDCPDIGFRVEVLGTDVYRLDRDGDGVGCDSY